MEKEITIYHVIVLEITKYVSYTSVVFAGDTKPSAVADANIKEMYTFRTQEEAMDKACELVKQMYETKSTDGMKVITYKSKLEL